VLVEDDCPPRLAAGRRLPDKSRTVVTPEFRFTRNSRGEELLFDTVADPDELTNLSPADTTRRAAALEAMMEAMLTADDLARGAPLTDGQRA
jgi:rRNA maturation endonuclease Nob1